ncbi:MAG: hypothetical protein ACLRS8_08460 [Parabacteroides merdae]
MRHLLFICLLLFCVACEENESVDPTIMPEATTTGANTFGCLVDGWVYALSGRWGCLLRNIWSGKRVPA